MVIYQKRLKEFLIQGEAIPSIGYRICRQLELHRYLHQPLKFVPIINNYITMNQLEPTLEVTNNLIQSLIKYFLKQDSQLQNWMLGSVSKIHNTLITCFHKFQIYETTNFFEKKISHFVNFISIENFCLDSKKTGKFLR